jgi:tetratricopeptide (TPR) repeat protein
MWSRRLSRLRLAAALVAVALLAGACHSAPPAKAEPAPKASAAPSAPAAAAPQPVVSETPPAQAQADFDRAVGLMRAGNQAAAEAQFQQLAAAYPSFAGPDINLGILYRKGGRLDQSEEALKSATARNNTSAVAWDELGVTLRMRGEFAAAASAYERAIGADANFAPAHRNLAVVLDLYLGDPERALSELERYQELAGEQKPVSLWIAELRQRTGKKKPAAAPAPATPAATPQSPTGPGDNHG